MARLDRILDRSYGSRIRSGLSWQAPSISIDSRVRRRLFPISNRRQALGLMLHPQGLDTTTPAGKAMLQMTGVFAEFERAMIRERVKAAWSRLALRQRLTAAILAFGASSSWDHLSDASSAKWKSWSGFGLRFSRPFGLSTVEQSADGGRRNSRSGWCDSASVRMGTRSFPLFVRGRQSRLFFALPFEERLFLVEALPDPAIKKRNGRDPRYDPRNGEEF